MLFVSRQRKIETLLQQYGQQVDRCISGLLESLEGYAKDQDRPRLERNYQLVHQAESRADDLRREIEVLMYSKSIFPESRGDILGLLETIDKVPNQAEKVLQLALTHHIAIPAELEERLVQLTAVCCRCVGTLLEAVGRLFSDFTQATAELGKIDELESEADDLQYALYEQIFAGDGDGLQKILLRDLVKSIASVSDRAENAADRLRIIVAKRNV
ncbi:MAG: DUF47 domain-containing protein [Sedimentisphaerales bacterium]|nr:DUF47 domain-containing protein [Sedimentisphaerales bacterium]